MNPQPQHPPSSASDHSGNYWGIQVMGIPVPPTTHQNNHHAPLNPYVQYETPPPPTHNFRDVRTKLNSWSNKAETTVTNIWTNLRTGPSVTGTAWGKANLTAKVLTEGGFESLYKHNFSVNPNEKLNKTFACYLSTSTGPIAGTLYLSNMHVAFCSDRPVSIFRSNGTESWINYRVRIPLERITTVNPITVPRIKQTDKYIQLSTIDGYDFWFMGFVNHEKASKHLLNGVSTGAKTIPLLP